MLTDTHMHTCTYTHTVINPPQAVLAAGTGGGVEVGEGRGMGGGADVTPPLDMDTTGRVVYWYSAQLGGIMNKSLEGNDLQV